MHGDNLTARFMEIYGAGDMPRLFFAPGRVNLIGEHTAYNGGHVLTCALNIGTYAAVRPRTDRIVRISSLSNGGGTVKEFSLDHPFGGEGQDHWILHPKGVIWAFEQVGYRLPRGMDILFDSDMPISAGLSSSASLGVVTAVALRDIFWTPELDSMELAKLVTRGATEYAREAIGITGPYASLMGVKDHAIFLTVPTLRCEMIPLCFENCRIVLTDTGVPCGFRSAEYNLRKSECEKALKKLQVVSNIKYLCDIGSDRFESCKDVIMNETYTKRARHAVYENMRSIRAVSALRVRNLNRVGELMKQSHISLRDDYEVSCPELDLLAENAWTLPGVIGSRMTGGGFGGCTITILREEELDHFCEAQRNVYREHFGRDPEFYVVEAGDGTREMTQNYEEKAL